MSDIERAAFEQAVADRWSDSYKFTRFGDEDYYDEVLEGMWWGWQASREEGEPIGEVGYMIQPNWDDPSKTKGVALVDKSLAPGTKLYTHPASADDSKHHAVMQAQMWAQEARTQKAIVKEIGEMVGCANDWEMVEAVRNALANVCVSQSAEYETQGGLSIIDDTQPASVPEWIKCSERLPESGITVLVSNNSGAICTCRRSVIERKNLEPDGADFTRERFTHWMPLPCPPKQEGE